METMEIYTIGNAYFLDEIFNAIKIIFSSGLTEVLKIAAAISLFLIVSKGAVMNDFKTASKWILGVVALTGFFLTAKARVVIHDQLPDQNSRTRAAYVVDGVPWGLAKIAWATSTVGKSIMDKFEAAFSGVTNNLTYRKYGILFGSKIIEDASRIKISNPDLSSFINKFYKQCVIPDLKIGHGRKNGYTLRELAETEDIASFLKNHASNARKIYLKGTITKTVKKEGFLGDVLGQTEKNKSSIDGYVTCNRAATYISDMIDSELDNNKFWMSSSFISQFTAGNKMSLKDKNIFYEAVLKDTYSSFLKSSRDASEILKQNIMINSLRDGAGSVSQAYGTFMTEKMTKSSFYSVSQVFQRFIPIIRSVFECLFYGVFPIVLVLMVTPIGLDVLKNYAFSFVYLQMWMPMYAILYCLMESWSRASSDDLKLNIKLLPQIEAINDEIAMVSGYMLALIPVLSMFVTKGLVASIGNMATSMMYIPQTAAVQTSDQSVTGNYHFGSTNMDNHSYDNLSAHKHDDNYSWMSGMKSFAMPSGSVYKEAASGHKMLDVAQGVSNLGGQVNIHWGKAIGSKFDESETIAQKELESSSHDYVESTASGLSKLLGFDKSFTTGTSANKSIQSSLTSDQREAFDRVKGITSRVSKSTGVRENDVIRAALGSEVGVGVGKLGISSRLEGSTTSEKQKSWDQITNEVNDQKFSEALSKVKSISHNNSLQSSDGETQTSLDSIRSDFNQSSSASVRYSNALEKMRSIQESRSNYENNSKNIDVGFNQKFTEYGINEFGFEAFEDMVRNKPEKLQKLASDYLAKEVPEVTKYRFADMRTDSASLVLNNNKVRDQHLNNNLHIPKIDQSHHEFSKKQMQEEQKANFHKISHQQKSIELAAIKEDAKVKEKTNRLASEHALKRLTE